MVWFGSSNLKESLCPSVYQTSSATGNSQGTSTSLVRDHKGTSLTPASLKGDAPSAGLFRRSDWRHGPSGNALKPVVLAQHTACALGSGGRRRRHDEPAAGNSRGTVSKTRYLAVSGSVLGGLLLYWPRLAAGQHCQLYQLAKFNSELLARSSKGSQRKPQWTRAGGQCVPRDMGSVLRCRGQGWPVLISP